MDEALKYLREDYTRLLHRERSVIRIYSSSKISAKW